MKRLILNTGIDIKDNFKILIQAQHEYIQEYINDENRDIHDKIHEIRKSFKKIRAILRLYRDSLGDDIYRKDNIFYRDLGRKLSDVRDKHVLVKNTENLIEELPGDLRNEQTGKLIESLTLERDKTLNRIKEEGTIALIYNELENKKRYKKYKINNEGYDVIRGGIKRIYKQARKYLASILDEPDNITIHDYRKRVKYLRYQMSVLRPIYPEMIKANRRILKKISDETGLHHDYTLLLANLEDNNFYNLDFLQLKQIQELIEEKREVALQNALEPSRKFFIEKPGKFTWKVGEYYRISSERRT